MHRAVGFYCQLQCCMPTRHCVLLLAGTPEGGGDEGLRLMQACMDSCGDLGLASLRLQSVTAAMCAAAHTHLAVFHTRCGTVKPGV